MYCLDKLQRELAYYFSKDIRELPKVENLLAEAGYTQIRKGDDIIKLDPALDRHSGDSSSQILESQATKEAPSAPTPPTQKGLFDEVDSKQIQNSHNLHTLRENAKTTLTPLINKEITNINTQEVATLTNKGIRKMTSDKAVAKSVANGFSEAEHFKAVEQVTKLFEKATKATSYTDPTDINLTIHRYNAPFENANALLTLKEYMQDGKRMYSLELENLDAIKFNPSGKDLMEQSPKSKDIDTANFNAPSENPSDTIPKLPFEMQVLAEDKLSGDEVIHLANKIGEKSTMAYFKDYLLKMDATFHARAKDIIREYYKIEPFRKELENQWENVKEAYKNGEMSLKEFKFLSKYKDEKSFLNQVAGVLWHQNDELVRNRGYAINKYGQIDEGKGNNYYQNLALEYEGALKNLKKWFYYIQKANKQAQRFFNKKELGDIGVNFESFTGKDNKITIAQEPPEPKTLSPQEAKELLESKQGQRLPQELDIQSFLKSLESVENKENFIAHLQKKDDAQSRLAYLHIIEPTLKHPDIELTKGERKTKIKVFNDGENFYSFLIADLADKRLFTFLPKARKGYIETKIKNADLIQTFTSQASKDQEPNGLASDIIPQATHQDYNTFNQSLKDAHDFFKANNKDPYNDKLFNDVIKVANALDIRFWYQPNAVWMGGSYTYTLNRIMLRSKDFSAENAKTMLHELIHSVTSRAIYAYENKALRAKLSKEQIEAITELKTLYKEVSDNNADKVWKTMATFRDEVENNKGKLYGLKNEHEMLAELANPTFREFLKEQNIFSKIVEAMAKIFSYVKDKLTGESVKSTNAQSELESILYKIMDSYTNPHAFTNEMSEHFGSRNFVDTTRYKEYIKDHKEKFDKDNYKGKHPFSFFDDSMDFYTKTAISGRETFFKGFIDNAYFDQKDFKIAQQLKWQMIDQYKRPTNFMELKTEKNAHIFQYIEQAQEKNIKDFVKEYYGVSYDEFNNAFNGAMKDKHFYEAKQFTYKNHKDILSKNHKDIPSKETAFLLALKPYFTSGLYKTLSEADFNVIKDNLYRILQDENLTYRNKPINEWLAKEWVEQDVKALQESFLYKLEQAHTRESGFNSQKGHQEQTIKAEPSIAKTDEQIVAQDSNALLESTMQKFNYDERKAKDLLEWHKDSSPLTKDENGVPKVFYHGTKWREIGNKIFEVFDTKYSNQVDKFLQGHYFSSSKKIARTYDANNIYKVFLNAKNPLVIDFKGHTFNDYIDEAINNIPKSVQENIRDFYDSIIFKNIIDDSTQNGKKHPVADTIMVLDSNQIKHIENRGIESEQGQKYFNEKSPNIFHSNPHAGAGLLGGSVSGVEQDENGNITFNPEKFALGLLGGAVGSIAISKTINKRASGKYAIMSRMEAKKHNKKLYNVFKAIDSSAKYGSKMNLIGKENLNADTLAYALARNKRFAINKLDEKTAKEMGFKYPHDVRRSIDPNNVAHTLNRHGEQSNLVQFSGQKPVTLDEIAKYQDYADNATHKGISIGKRQETANISARQLDGEFYVVVEQIQKGQNELGFKTMYFERGILNDEKFNKLLKK